MTRVTVEDAGVPPSRRLLAVALAAVLLVVTGVCASACGADYTPATGPSQATSLLQPDDGWVSAGEAGFEPVPFDQSVARQHSPQLIAATGSEARVKWLAGRAVVAGPEDARSTLDLHVVDVTDARNRADVVFRGAGGSGTADLPIEAGKRTVYKLAFGARGTYRRCLVLIEVRTQ